MTEEFLPVRVFAKREMDEQKVEGGGNNDTPNWVLVGDELSSRVSTLIGGLERSLFEKEHNSDLPYVFEVRLDERDTSKSKRRFVTDMLTPGSQPSGIVGMRGSNSLVLELRDIDEVNALKKHLGQSEKYKQAISCVVDIRRFIPSIELLHDGVGCYKVKLIPGAAAHAATSIFEEYLNNVDLAFKRVSYSHDTIIYKLDADGSQMRAVLDSSVSELLFSVAPMPRMRATLDMLDATGLPAITVPNDGEEYPVLGILDSGIASNSYIGPWLKGQRWSPYIDQDLDPSHGTFVAGVALYGDEMEGKTWVGGVNPRVIDAAVFPAAGVDEDELVDNIDRAMKLYSHEVKVWNLSISIDREIRDDEFSDFAAALDEIQDRYGVLICKSAGNCTNFCGNEEKGRLSCGADSVRALTVGSVAHAKGPFDAAEVGEASPFSRKGPGPEYIIKPEVCHYGGNAGIGPFEKISQTGVRSFTVDGGVMEAAGTSFSTPRVATLAASLASTIDGDFDPLLIKAMIIHSATFPGDALVPNDSKVDKMGFGIPGGVADMLSDNPYSSALVLRDTLGKGEAIDILDFPMPGCLVSDGRFTGQITLTLVSSPILDHRQGSEYCQSDIEVKFGSYDELEDRDITKPMILNPIGRKGAKNLLRPSLYSKRKQAGSSEDFAQRERMLIQYGGKYYSVKKYAIDLAELTDANLKAVEQGKHWFLRLKGTYRDAVERKSLETGEILEQDFCLMITVRDPKREAPVYNEVATLLNQYGFWHEAVKLSSNARVRMLV